MKQDTVPTQAERGYRIGELSQKSGLTTQTLRYYERLGLIAPTGRTLGGYRVYSAGVVESVLFIRRTRDMGFSLKEVRSLMELRQSGAPPSSRLRTMVLERIRKNQLRIRELMDSTTALLELLLGTETDSEQVLERLGHLG